MNEQIWQLLTTLGLIVAAALVGQLLRRVGGLKTFVQSQLTSATAEQGAKVSEAVATMQQVTSMIGVFTDLVRDVQRTTQGLTGGYESVVADLKIMNADYKTVITEQRKQIEAARVGFQQAMDEIDRLKTTVEALVKAKEQALDEIDHLKEKIGAMDAALTGAQDQLERTRQELKDTRDELQRTKAALEIAQRRIDEITRDRNAEQALAAEQKRQLEDELSLEHAKVQDLQKKVGEQQARITFLEGEVARLTALQAAAPPVAPEGGA